MPFWKKYPKNKIEDDPKVMEDVYAGPEMDEPEEPKDEAPKKKKKTRESMEAVYAGPPADEPMSRVYAGPEQMRRGGVMKAVYAAPAMTQPQPQPSPMMMVYAGPQQMAGMNGTAGMPGIMIPLPRADRFCPECGAPCRETARFCEMCGARLPEKAPKDSKAEEADVDPDTVPEEL